MDDNRWTKPNRPTEVIQHKISLEKIGPPPGIPLNKVLGFGAKFKGIQNGDTIWVVWTTTRIGLDKKGTFATFCLSEKEANEAASLMPVGTVFGGKFGFLKRFREIFLSAPEKDFSDKVRSFYWGVSEQDAVHSACYEALSNAGVISEKTYQISERVLDWLDQEHIEWMQEEFGEDWPLVGQLEYCATHFPGSSLATLAAKLFVAYFVAQDDFSAGYLTKEIEAISGGTEGAALKSFQRLEKAGVGGGKTSSARKQANLETLMCEIENLSSVADHISEELVLKEAIENAKKVNPQMPKTKSYLEDYLTILRCDEPFKSRYKVVFAKKA